MKTAAIEYPSLSTSTERLVRYLLKCKYREVRITRMPSESRVNSFQTNESVPAQGLEKTTLVCPKITVAGGYYIYFSKKNICDRNFTLRLKLSLMKYYRKRQISVVQAGSITLRRGDADVIALPWYLVGCNTGSPNRSGELGMVVVPDFWTAAQLEILLKADSRQLIRNVTTCGSGYISRVRPREKEDYS